ncbi:MAG: phage holin family protein [Bacteroidota bacterium]
MNFLIKLLISTLAVIITAALLPGVTVEDGNVLIALLVAAVLAFLNSLVKPVMIFLTIPFTLVTFGLFLLAINALIIMMADAIVDGFTVRSFWWALLFSIVMWMVTSILESVRKRDEAG